jgi:hypothetical protein
MKPAQMAEMMKKCPEEERREEGRPEGDGTAGFSDTWLNGRGYTPWKSYSHPTLGEVEIGGFTPFSDNTPPRAWLIHCLIFSFLCIGVVKRLPKLQ